MALVVKTVGIIGAGQMGNGIAQVFAAKNFTVRIYDIAPEKVSSGIDAIENNFQRLIAKGHMDEGEIKSAIEAITPTSDLKDFSDCDLVIEAATENQDIKTSIFQNLKGILAEDAILATNTSSISITKLAAMTDRPERFIGLHFMNPAPIMQLVEIIRGIATSKEVFDTIRALVENLDKTIAVSEDFPAFIVNRILMPMINEAIYTLYEGVGNVEAIDKGMKLGANHPMGPLELADFVGLDTCLAIMQVLYEGLADTKYRPCPLLVKYVEAGWLGRKTGRGFYDYSSEPPIPTR